MAGGYGSRRLRSIRLGWLYWSEIRRQGPGEVVYASVTQFTVDFRGDDMNVAQDAFERDVVPEMRKQAGYEGSYFLRTTKGSGVLISLWEDEATAQVSLHSGPFVDQMAALRRVLGKIDDEQTLRVGFADHLVEPD
jgi:hypothetical protein